MKGVRVEKEVSFNLAFKLIERRSCKIISLAFVCTVCGSATADTSRLGTAHNPVSVESNTFIEFLKRNNHETIQCLNEI